MSRQEPTWPSSASPCGLSSRNGWKKSQRLRRRRFHWKNWRKKILGRKTGCPPRSSCSHKRLPVPAAVPIGSSLRLLPHRAEAVFWSRIGKMPCSNGWLKCHRMFSKRWACLASVPGSSTGRPIARQCRSMPRRPPTRLWSSPRPPSPLCSPRSVAAAPSTVIWRMRWCGTTTMKTDAGMPTSPTASPMPVVLTRIWWLARAPCV